MVNILLYILGAIAVIAAGIYFFMRREPTPQSAADIGRAQSRGTQHLRNRSIFRTSRTSQFKRKHQQKLLKKKLNQKIQTNHLIKMMIIKINLKL